MATYPINDENPPTGAGYRPGDIVVCPPGSVVPRWKYVGDEQWVPANVVEFVENEVTGGIEIIVEGKEVGAKLGAALITYDSQGRVSTHDGWTMTYDPSGRAASQTKGTQTQTFNYDADGRFTGVTES